MPVPTTDSREPQVHAGPFVSIIIPCRNEEQFIGQCLDSILANDFPKHLLEILVIDGNSDDQTRMILGLYSQRYPFIRILENPTKITPTALNLGIKSAKGEILMRMDAHATYDRQYISRSVRALREHAADNVGGAWKTVPRNEGLVGKAIVRALSHRFGIGNTHYRLGTSRQPMVVDTVPFFCCKKQVFERVGLFNEKLVRGQDMEFNLRLRRAGGRTLLVPDVVSYYYARSDMKAFMKHNWGNGVWAILPFLYSDGMPVSWRHLIPLGLVVVILGSVGMAFLWPSAWRVLGAIAVGYGGLNVAAAAHVAMREKDIRYLAIMPAIFAGFHFAYGLGSLWGVARVVTSVEFWKHQVARRGKGQHTISAHDNNDKGINRDRAKLR